MTKQDDYNTKLEKYYVGQFFQTQAGKEWIDNNNLSVNSYEKITHFLKCTEQAELRAQEQWLKQACEYRRRMLIRQLASMKEKSVV